MNKEEAKKVEYVKEEWTIECEELLAEWSEKASCYRWLHGRCEKSYRTWYYCFSIPVIILSTLTGAANVGMDSFVPAESKSLASAIVGGVNILAGIVSTLQNFLKVAELMEGHRIAGVSWGKLQRNIAIELALDPNRRVIQGDFLKMSRSEYDRLIESGPIIDDNVIKHFNKKFKNYGVSVPSICNGLDKCKIYKVKNVDNNNIDNLTDGVEDIIAYQETQINKTHKENLDIVKITDNVGKTDNVGVKCKCDGLHNYQVDGDNNREVDIVDGDNDIEVDIVDGDNNREVDIVDGHREDSESEKGDSEKDESEKGDDGEKGDDSEKGDTEESDRRDENVGPNIM